MIGVTKLTKVFVLFNVLSFQVQSAGAGFQAWKKPEANHIGQILALAALLLHIVVFGFFLAVAAAFQEKVIHSADTTVAGSFALAAT